MHFWITSPVYPNYKSFTAKLDALLDTFLTPLVLNMLIISDWFMLFRVRSCQRCSPMQNIYLFHSGSPQNHFIFCKSKVKAQIMCKITLQICYLALMHPRKASWKSLTQHNLSLRLGLNRLSSPVGQLWTQPYGDDGLSSSDLVRFSPPGLRLQRQATGADVRWLSIPRFSF